MPAKPSPLASRVDPLRPAQMAELEKKAEPVHRQALFFRRWA